MTYYQSVLVNNLDSIIQSALELLPAEDLDRTHLFYIDDSVDKFLKIPELAAELKRLGYYDYVYSIAFFILMPGVKGPIHIDSGDTVFSFNIPLQGCKGTRLNFYSTTSKPVAHQTAQNKVFYAYNSSDCTLVESLEMTAPTVINVTYPHSVFNYNSENAEPRITLLIRLNENIGTLF